MALQPLGAGHGLRPEQLQRTTRSVRVIYNVPSEALIGQTAWNEARWHSALFRFDASDAEVYEVVSAVDRPIDALPLLADGIRTAEAADDYLRARGLHSIRANSSEFAQACLERRIAPAQLFELADYKDEILLRQGDQRGVADSIAFRLTPLGQRMATDLRGAHLFEDMGRGMISFDDLRRIGLTRLGTFDRLPSLRGVLRQIRAGQGEWTPRDLKELIDRAAGEDLTDRLWEHLGRICEVASPEQLATVESVRFAALIADHASAAGLTTWAQTPAFGLYVGQIGEDVMRDSGYRAAHPFFEAGVPVDVARKVLGSGGALTAAQGIVEGIEPGIAGGWL